MRISRLLGLIAAASVLAACSGQNSGVIGHPGATGGSLIRLSSHALVAPGHAGQMAIMPGAARHAGGGVRHDFTASSTCTYLTDNISGDVKVYNNNLTLGGDFASTSYGWGALATHSSTNPGLIYLGKNDGSGSVDVYTHCTNSFVGSVTGLGDGGAAYGIAGFKGPGKHGYATDFPNDEIQYWATGSGTAVSKVDPLTGLPYFVEVDKHNKVWISGWDPGFTGQQIDRCSATITACKTMVFISGGFPGGVQVDSNDQLYVNDQYGTVYGYDCSSLVSCSFTGSFTYSNGSNPLDYTAIALDPLTKKTLWGANIYVNDGVNTCKSSNGLCGDAQSQSLPLSSATLGGATPQWDNAEPLGLARFKPDTP